MSTSVLENVKTQEQMDKGYVYLAHQILQPNLKLQIQIQIFTLFTSLVCSGFVVSKLVILSGKQETYQPCTIMYIFRKMV